MSVPIPDDVVWGSEADIASGVIVQPGRPPAFEVYAEANVDAPKLWPLFEALVRALLPSIAAPLIGFKGEEPSKGHYTDRDLALAEFRPFRDALENDGFLHFGMIFQHNGVTEEVYVEPAKYLKVWSNRPDVLRAVFAQFGISEVQKLSFLDEFPLVTDAIPFQGASPGYARVLEALQAAFAALPQR
ncbi:MAG TPA: hypothetical protein VJ650_16155 [Gemmatimonadaceae bacterium]|nr:hypothetical protein [Gemmatimonadaceae bacterium]